MQIQIPDFVRENREREQSQRNAMMTRSHLASAGLEQQQQGMQNQEMQREQQNRAELESLLTSTPPEQRDRVGLEWLKVRDPDKAGKLAAMHIKKLENLLPINPQQALAGYEQATGEKVEYDPAAGLAYVAIDGQRLVVSSSGAPIKLDKPEKSTERIQAEAQAHAMGTSAGMEGQRNAAADLEEKKRLQTQAFTAGEGAKRDATRLQAAGMRRPLAGSTGRPRFVQYSAPDGSFSKMVDVNDPTERTEMETQGWTPGAPAKLGAKQQQDLETTQELDELVKEIRALYKPGYVGKFDSAVKGTVKEFTGMIGNEEATFRTKVQSLLNQVGKLRAGAAWTAPEINRLLKEIPNSNMADVPFQAALANAEQWISRKLNSVESVGAKTGTRVNQPVNPAGGGGKNRRVSDKSDDELKAILGIK